MEFENPKPIYRQIGDRMCDRIVQGEWAEDQRIPSVRDLAMEMQVNPNTAIRAFEELQSRAVIFNRRGVGYFVEPGARKRILDDRRAEFIEESLPAMFRRMELLGVDIEGVEACYKKYKQLNKQ